MAFVHLYKVSCTRGIRSEKRITRSTTSPVSHNEMSGLWYLAVFEVALSLGLGMTRVLTVQRTPRRLRSMQVCLDL